jgi:hypothetical protein
VSSLNTVTPTAQQIETTVILLLWISSPKKDLKVINDLMVFSATTLTAFTSGYFHYKFG